jgi:hypothetical protein
MSYRPYSFWSKFEMAEHLYRVASRLNMGTEVKELIRSAMTDVRWNPREDFNGCSVVQDIYHPCVSCFIHDYLWITGQGGKDADYVFYELMLMEGMSRDKSGRRWFAVRVAWLFYFKWKYLATRNVNEYTDHFKKVLSKFKSEKSKQIK